MDLDGGFGDTGNLSLNILLDFMEEDVKKKFINELKKDYQSEYNEFLEYQKILKKNMKK